MHTAMGLDEHGRRAVSRWGKSAPWQCSEQVASGAPGRWQGRGPGIRDRAAQGHDDATAMAGLMADTRALAGIAAPGARRQACMLVSRPCGPPAPCIPCQAPYGAPDSRTRSMCSIYIHSSMSSLHPVLCGRVWQEKLCSEAMAQQRQVCLGMGAALGQLRAPSGAYAYASSRGPSSVLPVGGLPLCSLSACQDVNMPGALRGALWLIMPVARSCLWLDHPLRWMYRWCSLLKVSSVRGMLAPHGPARNASPHTCYTWPVACCTWHAHLLCAHVSKSPPCMPPLHTSWMPSCTPPGCPPAILLYPACLPCTPPGCPPV